MKVLIKESLQLIPPQTGYNFQRISKIGKNVNSREEEQKDKLIKTSLLSPFMKFARLLLKRELCLTVG